MINTQYINLNMTPSGVMPVMYCSQYDIGRPLGMVVYNGSEAVDLDSYTCTIEATRTDGTAITAAVTTDDNIGVFTTSATMTNQADKYPVKLVLFDSNSRRVASLAFIMCVTPRTMNENAESIEEDESLYQQFTGTVQTLIAEIREDLAGLGDHVDAVEDALNSTPFAAERIFRKVATRDASTGRSSAAAQCMAIVGDHILCAGRTLPDDSAQIINEYDMTGNLIRSQTYTSSDLGHFSDITYDSDRSLLYASGTGTTIVVIRYSDLAIQETHTVTGLSRISALAYDNGILYGGAAEFTGVIDLTTWVITPMITYNPAETNQNYAVVRQTMAIYDGHLYIAYNRTNQLLKINLATWTVERSIIIGKGNGTYPYGEIEGIAFYGDRLYMVSSVWFNGSIGIDSDGNIIQIFKTNIGAPLVIHNDIGQASGGYTTVLHVNAAGVESTSLNPNGTTDAPFNSLKEACAYLNYQASINPDIAYRLEIHSGNSHDYSKDTLLLANVTVYIRADSTVTLRTLTLNNCVAFLRNINITNEIRIRTSIAQLRQITAPSVNAFYSILYIGAGNSITGYTLEGSLFFPYAFSDIENIVSKTASPIMRYPYTYAEITSSYLSGVLTVDRADRTAVLSYKNTFTIPSHTLTTICTLPDQFKPVRNYVYDLIDRPLGTDLFRIRVYVNTDGTVQFYNYDTEQTEFTNIRLHMVYITVE